LSRDPEARCYGVVVHSEHEHEHMEAALALAGQGRRSAHPNPLVGALVVADGEVVGSGFHRGPGTPHAEVVALDEAGDRARGATLYVNLEPCCHQGLTPPCTERIIAEGVGRVVAAMRDPNPEVDGKGFARLREAGVAVSEAAPDLSHRAEALNEAFTKYVRSGLPFVTFKAAVSLDGKVAAAGGDARWISSSESRRRVHEMRAAADAVMVGAGTVRRDDPRLTVRDAAGDDPVRVVISRHAEIPFEAALVAGDDGPQTIVVAESVEEGQEAALRERGVEVIETGEAGLEAGLRALAQRGLLDILCEGGPSLAGALVAAGLVDRACLFVAPVLVGRGAPELLALPAVGSVSEAWRLQSPRWEIVGPDAMVTGTLARPGLVADHEAKE